MIKVLLPTTLSVRYVWLGVCHDQNEMTCCLDVEIDGSSWPNSIKRAVLFAIVDTVLSGDGRTDRMAVT